MSKLALGVGSARLYARSWGADGTIQDRHLNSLLNAEQKAR